MAASKLKNLEDAFSDIVRQWFAALAEGRDVDAISMIDEANSYGLRWTTDGIRSVIADYGAKVVTHPDKVPGKPHSNLVRFNDESGFACPIAE